MYQKQRKDFGRHCKFSDTPAEILIDLRPEPALTENHMERNPCTTNVQVVPEMSEHEVSPRSDFLPFSILRRSAVCLEIPPELTFLFCLTTFSSSGKRKGR
jgi:hypothetical protein